MFLGRIALFSIALAVVLPAAMLAQAPANTTTPKPKKETQAQLQKEATITLAEASATAQKEEPGAKLTAHELEREKGKLIYSLEFKVPGKTGIDEVNIDAKTGALVDKSHESPADEKKEAAGEASKPPVKKP